MNKKSRLRYAKKLAPISPANTEKLSGNGFISWKLYQDCRVPLEKFLSCLYDKDYDELIIKGNPPKEEIELAWTKIYMEYLELVNDGAGNELYDKMIAFNYLAGKICVVDKIVKHLKIAFNSDLLKILKFYGVHSGIKDTDDVNTRIKKLEITIGRVKRWQTDLDVLKKELGDLQEQNKDKSGGYGHFEDALMNICVYRKMSIPMRDLSVRQFVKHLKSIEQEAMRQASAQND